MTNVCWLYKIWSEIRNKDDHHVLQQDIVSQQDIDSLMDWTVDSALLRQISAESFIHSKL